MTLRRNRDFMRLWSAQTISQLGTQVTLLALPLTAVLALKATAFQVGLLGTFEFLPFILVGLPAGVWVDRMRRKPILVIGDVGRAVALGSIPVAHWLDVLSMPQLYVVALTTGVFTVFFDVAYQSYLPALVERDEIVEGNAKLEATRSAAQLAGPGLAGLLIGAVQAPVAILADAASFLLSGGLVARIGKPESPPPKPEHRPRMRSEIAVGLRYVLTHPLLRWIAMCTGLSNLFFTMITALLVLYAVRELGMTPGEIGLVFTLGNAGVLVGALIAGRIARRFGIGHAIAGSAVLFATSPLLIPLAPRSAPIPLLVTAELIFGFTGVVYNINQVSLRQAITPLDMQGRMNATMRFLVWGTMPVGSFVAGVLGNAIGLHETLWIAAIGSCTSFLPVMVRQVRTLERIPDAGDAVHSGESPPV